MQVHEFADDRQYESTFPILISRIAEENLFGVVDENDGQFIFVDLDMTVVYIRFRVSNVENSRRA